MEYRKILVPVDGSKLSDLAFEQALYLSRMNKAKVTVVHVASRITVPYADILGDDLISSISSLNGGVENMGKDILERYRERGKRAGVDIDTRLLVGDVPTEIVRASEDFDLVVMGIHGKEPLSSLFLGNTAKKVTDHCRTHILLVRERTRKTG
ncbi:MAG TPA: universal stress protein [Euryarchaeota archaeon]|nr:universal stress protein [Euryarchaeota archaeon]